MSILSKENINADKHRATLPVSEMDDKKLLDLKKFIVKKGKGSFLYEPAFTDESADKDISRVIVDKGSISGVILLQSGGEELYVTGLSGKNRLDNLALCHGALLAAKKK